MTTLADECTTFDRSCPITLYRGPPESPCSWTELLQVLRSSVAHGNLAGTSVIIAPLLAKLLAAHGRSWPVLQVPDRLMIDAVFGDDSVDLRVESNDEFESVLTVKFDFGGKLLTWRSWSEARPCRAKPLYH